MGVWSRGPGGRFEDPFEIMSVLVVCDASPLIFLAKVDRLELVRELVGDQVVVLQGVVNEVLHEKGRPEELGRLTEFLDTVQVVDFVTDRFFGNQLSLTDRSSLAWALENGATRLLVDEVLLRRVARAEGLEVVGVMGVFVQATKVGLLTKAEVLGDLKTLIEREGMRISLGLYRKVLESLEE